MKTRLILLVLLALSMSIVGSAQLDLMSGNPVEAICPNGEPYNSHPNWDIYYTVNDQFDGEVDTTFCFDVVGQWGYIQFLQDDYIPGRPIFMKYVGDSILLDVDRVYALSSWLGGENMDLDNLNYCNEGFCQGMKATVRVPSAPSDTVNEFAYREHSSSFMEMYFPQNGMLTNGSQFLCFPTEKFLDNNVLTDILLKIIPEEGVNFQVDLYLNGEDWNWQDYTIPGFAEPDYYTQLDDLHFQTYINPYWNEGIQAALLLHTEEGYPDADNLSFFDLAPTENPDTIATIDLILEEDISLISQPWSFFRGGLVDGSDSLRHNLNIINQGADICFVGGYEVTIQEDESYLHKAGNLSFNGKGACMQFQSGSQFIIAEESHLRYGNSPMGMLYMFNGAEIIIEKHGVLEISNQVFLNNNPTYPNDRIDVELRPFSSLRFAKGSTIGNWSPGGSTKLHIYLKGGHLDIGHLDDESRSNIVIHYPEDGLVSEMIILDHPVNENLEFGWESDLKGLWNCRLFTLDGKLIDEFKVAKSDKLQFFRRNISYIDQGMYILLVDQGQERFSNRFVKQ